ncbi:MAG: inositol monophosphatase family protein, partial [Planctomycetota bacterium]
MTDKHLTIQELNELANVAKQAALAGGRELLNWRGKFEVREKGPSDYVTDADVASQNAIRALLGDRYPDHAFVGEESANLSTPPDSDKLCWVVDPLDGTTNYLHDFPAFGVSVAVVRDGQPLAGAIFDPIRD